MTGTPAVSKAVLRAMVEGVPQPIETIARATARSANRLRRLAEAEGWGQAAGGGARQALDERLLALSNRLVAELEAIGEAGLAEDGAFDRPRIDALSAMLKMIEKLGEITRGPERARKKQIETDDQMSAALARIDARIFTLARELAAEMGGAEPDGRGNGADPQ